MALNVSVDDVIAQTASRLLKAKPHWPRARLGEIGSVLNGFAFKSALFTRDSGMPLVRIRDVGSAASETYYCGEFDPRYIINRGDLLIGMDGDFNCARWRGPRSLLNQRVCKVTTDTSVCDPRWVEYLLPGYLRAINEATSSITVKHLSSRTIEEIPLPLPPIDEQLTIVAEIEKQFSRLDEAVANLLRVKANLRRYKASVLEAAVEGRLVETEASIARREARGYKGAEQLLKEIVDARQIRSEARSTARDAIASASPVPAGWTSATVDQLAQVGTGATPRRDKTAYWTDGDVPWVTSSVVSSGDVYRASEFVTPRALAETNLTLYPAGTLVLAMYGEGKTRGQCAELHISSTTNQALAALQVEGRIRRYLRIFLEHNYEETRKLASGGVQPNLNLSLIRAIRVPLPPLAEQERIVAEVDRRLSIVRELEAEVEANLKRAQALRQATLSRAFS
jgi:type I restriction enzyme, S subunit